MSISLVSQPAFGLATDDFYRVRVINVISGEVGTNILRRDAKRSLPSGSSIFIVPDHMSNSLGTGSLYLRLADDFRGHVQRTPSMPHIFISPYVD